MHRRIYHRIYLCILLACGLLLAACSAEPTSAPAVRPVTPDTVTVRMAAYNIEDVRQEDLENPSHPRLQAVAAEVQRLRPDVILLSEVAYDQPGAPGYRDGEPAGQNALRFAERFLAVPQEPGLEPLRYAAFAAPVNTGLASGFDLDGDGQVVRSFPPPEPAGPGGEPGIQTAEGRLYGNDAWGFGTFPGQYGMALLVREGLEILTDSVRTFRLLPWSRMPGAEMPVDPATGESWYDAAERAAFRLSSKSHWDVPVRLPNGTVLHLLASHPTPPAFDGAERRNVLRNAAEIRFWRDYIDGAAYVVDDSSRAGGLPAGASFVILGDLNADLDEGLSHQDPVGTYLLAHPRIDGTFVPQADTTTRGAYPSLSPDDTAIWGMRVDYVLPSADLRVRDGGVRRPPTGDGTAVRPSDHFMIWLDLGVPPRPSGGQASETASETASAAAGAAK